MRVNKGFAFITQKRMMNPIEDEYGKTSNFVTRENNNKKKRSTKKKGKEIVKRISRKIFLREIVVERGK